MHSLAEGAIGEIKAAEHILNTEIILHPLQPALCDHSLIYRVWINLINNAVKYSRNKEKPIVEIGMAEKNGEQVYFVKDNGVGFDMKNADRLFSVFQRLSKYSLNSCHISSMLTNIYFSHPILVFYGRC